MEKVPFRSQPSRDSFCLCWLNSFFPSCKRAFRASTWPISIATIRLLLNIARNLIRGIIYTRDLLLQLQIVPAFATIASKKFNDCVSLRRASTIFAILLIGFSNTSDMVRWNFNGKLNWAINRLWGDYYVVHNTKSSRCNINRVEEFIYLSFTIMQFASSLRASSVDYIFSPISGENGSSAQLASAALNFTSPTQPPPWSECIFPSYFSHFAILLLIAISVVTQLSHLTKILLMIIVTGKWKWMAERDRKANKKFFLSIWANLH